MNRGIEMSKELDVKTLEFIGDKSHTLSFRLRTKDLRDLLDGRNKVVTIRGQKFKVEKCK